MSERRDLAIAYFQEHHPDSLTLQRLENLCCWGDILDGIRRDGLQSLWINLIKEDREACVQSLGNDVFRRSLDAYDRLKLMRSNNAIEFSEAVIAYYGRIDAPDELPKGVRRRLTTIACKSGSPINWRLRRYSMYDGNNFDWVERIIIWWYCLEW